MRITLFTIDCPKCKILEKKLSRANIEYETCKDREIIASKGFDLMPILDVDGQIMGFGEAVKWVNERS